MPSGLLTNRCPKVGSFSSSLSRNFCISLASSSTPAEASWKSAASSGSYLSPDSPLSLVQSRTSNSYDAWIGPAAAAGRRISSANAISRSRMFRNVRVSVASALISTLATLGRTAHGRIQGVHVMKYVPTSRQDVADAEFRVETSGREPQPNRHCDHNDDVGRRPAGNAPPQQLCQPPDTRAMRSRLGGAPPTCPVPRASGQ